VPHARFGATVHAVTSIDATSDPQTGENADQADPYPGRAPGVVRIADIAKHAGVSPSTVSRVLNNAPSTVPIAEATRVRILAAARELDYRPNPFARALRGASTQVIGVVVRDFGDPFNASAIEALAVDALKQGYSTLLGHVSGTADESLPLAEVLETRHCDAILLLSDMQDQPRLLADLERSLVPVVALWQGSAPVRFPTVNVNDHTGIVLGIDHLVGLGHRDIAMVSAELPGNNSTREDAFRAAAESRIGSVPAEWIRNVPNSPAGGDEAMRALLALDRPPTAVIAATDIVAYGALHGAYAAGRRVPDDISVVGFDDLVLAAYTVPALTTIRMPIAEIAGAGLRLAIGLATNQSARREPTVTTFEPVLVVRSSTGPPARRT
jgi:DNA-binding LacI/PurR family transcriptional regulator